MKGCYVMILFVVSCLQSPVLTCTGDLQKDGPVPFIKPSSRLQLGSSGIIRFWSKATRYANEVPTVCPSQEAHFCEDSELFCQLYDVNECDESPCQNRGICLNFHGGYNCTCKTGWNGTNCDADINECDSSPCQNNGTCLNFDGGYNCTCGTGWQGTNCDTDINECDGSPCQNNGTCLNFDGGYNCTCGTGWQGTICDTDINECDGSPCQNNGTCLNFDGGYNCTCGTGWQGTICDTDINECDGSPCQNNGTCLNFDGGYNCTCGTGWQGTICDTDINECNDSPCQNNGTCLNFDGGYNCTCESGWNGTNCDTDINECDSSPCQNNGTCLNFDGGYNCTCETGWNGTNCDTDINECNDSPCQNNGTCLNFDGGYNCTCESGWNGTNCDTDINECNDSPCQNNGTCLNFDGGYNCTCETGWQGTNCDTDFNECENNPCRNNGKCLNFDGGYNCTCKPQWQGNNCGTVLGPPRNVTFIHISRTEFWMEWYPPRLLKGYVKKYEIRYQAKQRPYLKSFDGEENETIFELRNDTKFGKVGVNITSLDPSTVYEIQVSAFTTVGQGKRVAKTIATLVETNLTELREEDVKISTSQEGFEISLPGLSQKYATHYVVRILNLCKRKHVIMTEEFNKTENVTVFRLKVDNIYGSFNGIVWGKAIYQINIGTQSKLRENKNIVWSDEITLRVPAWLNPKRVFIATVLTVIFVTVVTMLCRLQAYYPYEAIQQKDLGKLEVPKKCCTSDQSYAELLKDSSKDVERYARVCFGSVVREGNSEDELKKELAAGGTDEEGGTAKDGEENDYGHAFVTAVVEKAPSHDECMKQGVKTSVMVSFLDNSSNDLKTASGVIPEKVHPIRGQDKLDPIDEMVLDSSEYETCILPPEKENSVRTDAVSVDSLDEDDTKRVKEESEEYQTKDFCGEQETSKSDHLLEDMECGTKMIEIQNSKEDNSRKGTGPRDKTTSESDDVDVCDDFGDLNLTLNNAHLNDNNKPGLSKAMFGVLKGDKDPKKKSTKIRGSEVNSQVNDQTEEHDFCNVAINADDEAYVLKEFCSRKNEDLQSEASVQSAPKCHLQKKESDPYLKSDVCLKKSRAIEKEYEFSGDCSNGTLLPSFCSKIEEHSEENELGSVENVVPENESPNESNMSVVAKVPYIHETAIEEQRSEATHCAGNASSTSLTGESIPVVFGKMAKGSLVDLGMDIYDETCVEEGCRSTNTNQIVDASNVPLHQDIYDENCVESEKSYINTDRRKLPARPEMFNNSQIRQIRDDAADLYLDTDVSGVTVTGDTSEVYEMIPAEDNASKRRQSSFLHSFRNKKLFQSRKSGTKKASFPNLPPIPRVNKFSRNTLHGDISPHSYEQSFETNVDEDIYEELPEDGEVVEMST